MSKCNFNYGLVYVRKPRVIGQDYCIALGWSISQSFGAGRRKIGERGGDSLKMWVRGERFSLNCRHLYVPCCSNNGTGP